MCLTHVIPWIPWQGLAFQWQLPVASALSAHGLHGLHALRRATSCGWAVAMGEQWQAGNGGPRDEHHTGRFEFPDMLSLWYVWKWGISWKSLSHVILESDDWPVDLGYQIFRQTHTYHDLVENDLGRWWHGFGERPAFIAVWLCVADSLELQLVMLSRLYMFLSSNSSLNVVAGSLSWIRLRLNYDSA